MKDLNNSLASKDKSLRQSRKSSASPSPSPSSGQSVREGYRDDQPLIDSQHYATTDQHRYYPDTTPQGYDTEGVLQQQGQRYTLSEVDRQRYMEEYEQRYYPDSVQLDYSREAQEYSPEPMAYPSESERKDSTTAEEGGGEAGGGLRPSRMSLGNLVGYLMSGAAKKVGLTKGPKLPEYER